MIEKRADSTHFCPIVLQVTGEAAIPQTNSAERKTKRSTEETPVETKEIEERASPGKCLKVAAAFQWEQATQAQSDEDRDSDEEDEEDEEVSKV